LFNLVYLKKNLYHYYYIMDYYIELSDAEIIELYNSYDFLKKDRYINERLKNIYIYSIKNLN